MQTFFDMHSSQMQCFRFPFSYRQAALQTLFCSPFSDDDLTLFLVIVKFAKICVWFKRLVRVYRLLHWLYIYCLLDACD